MEVLRTIAEVRAWRGAQSRVALVPTMGAFHEGHLSLMRTAGRDGHEVAVSLFVNPTQFLPHEDLSKYPRREAEDLAAAEAAGVAAVFAPPVEEMYRDSATRITMAGPALGWEGDVRPGHFDGVATVVAKLLNIFTPHRAVFGWKDLQQCAVIRRMVRDLDFGSALEFVETLRESDGLAMSSRNVYLTPEARAQAAGFPRILRESAEALTGSAGADWAKTARCTEADAAERLRQAGFEVDYVAVVDPETLRLAEDPKVGPRIASATRIGSVRLIDNWPIFSPR